MNRDTQVEALGACKQLTGEAIEISGMEVVVLELDMPRSLPSGLTAAEASVVELLLDGHGMRTIAALRRVSYRTVANQLASIYRKAGVCTMQELLAKVIQGL